jgi:TPR repeat protein
MSACTSQALMLLSGHPLKPNPKKARELLDAACDGTDARGCLLLGDALDRGANGWKRSPLEARRAWERAALIVESPCRKGEAEACALASLLSVEGRGGPPAGADARERVSTLCGKDDAIGCATLGQAWLAPALGAPSPAKAMEALQLGCQGKEPVACRRLASLLQTGGEGVPADPASAAALFESGCDENDGPSCFALSKLTLAASPLPKDAKKKAKALAKKACKLGVKEGCR